MLRWVRYLYQGTVFTGCLEGDAVSAYEGNIFCNPTPTNSRVALADVKLLTPTIPGNFIGLWNNFYQRATKENWQIPQHPLYFVKTSGCLLPSGGTILRPTGYGGDVAFEAELGIVIGRECYGVDVSQVADYIFGYTCINDVTARGWLNADESFKQWSRAKSCPTFGVIGPVIASGFDPSSSRVIARINGEVLQDYLVADMIFSPTQIVAALSQDMLLMPGDVIACGTSLGAVGLPDGAVIEVEITGLGVQANTFSGAQ